MDVIHQTCGLSSGEGISVLNTLHYLLEIDAKSDEEALSTYWDIKSISRTKVCIIYSSTEWLDVNASFHRGGWEEKNLF